MRWSQGNRIPGRCRRREVGNPGWARLSSDWPRGKGTRVHLTGLDLLFWAAGFAENLALLFVLWYRSRVKEFPFFTALVTLVVIKTIALYFVNRYGTKSDYAYVYWTLAIVDMTLQLCVVYEIASLVFRPLDVWI